MCVGKAAYYLVEQHHNNTNAEESYYFQVYLRYNCQINHYFRMVEIKPTKWRIWGTLLGYIS